ncbi:MAG TPA: CDP-diacylglycerol--serine O-phosphatidyltransferase [Myxococcota bacterium]|nr:CDP-diacylglycerol--serine O-phosphatidyltransferase [Myxococcota bacterium]HQK50535.1 CDP-diacylglycerol--serine O-phosphatidyltransferase [Myxococcota bacterium]
MDYPSPMDLRQSKFILPNLFTLSSILLGMWAILSCMPGTDEACRNAALAIILAAIADGIDGRVARLTRTESAFGVELDSLADVLSFGMAPAVLSWVFALRHLDGHGGYVGTFLAFFFVACGALRLARFNVQAARARGPTGYFTGLPIPGGAGIIATLCWTLVDLEVGEPIRTVLVGSATVTMAVLMVSTVRYRNFKHVRIGPWGKAGILIGACLLLIAVLKTHTSAVLLTLGLLYVVLGPAEWFGALVWRVLRPGRRPSRPRKW